jgi:hypothetical protein
MHFRGRVLLILAIMLTASSANAGPNEQAFCEAYASAAVTTVNEALSTGCKTQDNGRWDPLFDDHLNVCLNVWVRDPVNGGLVAINETLFRALDLSTCLFSQAHVTPTWGSADVGYFLSRLCGHRGTAVGGHGCLWLRLHPRQV